MSYKLLATNLFAIKKTYIYKFVFLVLFQLWLVVLISVVSTRVTDCIYEYIIGLDSLRNGLLYRAYDTYSFHRSSRFLCL